jgi:hypothetical protein
LRPFQTFALLATFATLATFAVAGARAAAQTASAGASGPLIEVADPPSGAESWPKACSLRRPICVHATARTPTAAWLAVLDSAERAWDALTDGLEMPPPDGSMDGIWHAYLVDGVDGGGCARLEDRDPRAHFDRGASFALVDPSVPHGCPLDRALMRAVARGSLWRSAPAMDPGTALAQVETIARLTSLCSSDPSDVAAFQSRPERALINPSSTAFDRGASLFFGWIDATFGASPGALLQSSWALSPTRTRPEAWRWAGTPTAFDVLRASLGGLLWQGSTLDDVFVRFAIERVSMDPAPRLAWQLAWPARARRLAAPEPVEPTGASYVRVDLAGAPPNAKLRVEAEWEDYGRMRWVAAKLDAGGRVLARIPVGSLDRGTHAAVTVENLDGVDRVLVVGVNVGSTDQAFDPDQGEWEPHGWLLTLGAD